MRQHSQQVQELSANKINLDHPRTCASSAVRKMSGNRFSIYFGIACPPKASVVAFDFTEIGTFRSQLLTNIHQFTGRV